MHFNVDKTIKETRISFEYSLNVVSEIVLVVNEVPLNTLCVSNRNRSANSVLFLTSTHGVSF